MLTTSTAMTIPAFEDFFEQQHVRFARALYALTGSASEAEELAQDALVRVYERWDRVSRMASPDGYLFRTALNLQRSRVRRLASRARQIFDPAASVDPADIVQQRDSIGRALDTLPLGQRGAVILVEWVGMSHEDAAKALRIKPTAVRTRLSRAKAALRDQGTDDA